MYVLYTCSLVSDNLYTLVLARNWEYSLKPKEIVIRKQMLYTGVLHAHYKGLGSEAFHVLLHTL